MGSEKSDRQLHTVKPQWWQDSGLGDPVIPNPLLTSRGAAGKLLYPLTSVSLSVKSALLPYYRALEDYYENATRVRAQGSAPSVVLKQDADRHHPLLALLDGVLGKGPG